VKKVRMMARSRKQAGRLRPSDADLRHQIVHDYTEIDPNIAWAIDQNEVSRLSEKSESLLEETNPSG